MTRNRLRLAAAAAAVAVLLVAPPSIRAQEGAPAIVLDVARKVLIDPTTYAPAVISFEAMSQDWKTSQVLFDHGWLEANQRFTISGRPNDLPVTYDTGKRRIRSDALTVLQYSVVNNVAAAVGERLLMARYPSHRKLVRTLSWIERIAFASIIAYRNSSEHLQQARTNRRLAREYGYISP